MELSKICWFWVKYFVKKMPQKLLLVSQIRSVELNEAARWFSPSASAQIISAKSVDRLFSAVAKSQKFLHFLIRTIKSFKRNFISCFLEKIFIRV